MIESNWQEVITPSQRGEMGPHTVNAADEEAVPGEGRILSNSFYAYILVA